MTKKEIDIERIQKRFREIETRLKFLRESAKIDKLKFITDHRIASSTERDLEIVIQACLDVADHLIAKIGLELPKMDRKETFSILAKNKIVPQALVPKLTAMAGQRNILIHEYLEVERDKIYQTINEDLGDIVKFVQAVQKYLDRLK